MVQRGLPNRLAPPKMPRSRRPSIFSYSLMCYTRHTQKARELCMAHDSSGLLAIDVGNTNVHLGLWRDNRWQPSWRARTVPDKMPDEYAVLVRNFLSSADLGYAAISGVIISSVVPPLTRTLPGFLLP